MAGDLKKGKKALRVTIEYNIPVKTFISLLKAFASLGVILEKYLGIYKLYTWFDKPWFEWYKVWYGEKNYFIVMSLARGKVFDAS